MPSRSRKHAKAYNTYRKTLPAGVCQFCEIKTGSPDLVKESAHFKVIKNIFPYSLWDTQAVADHVMLVPKQHSDSIGNLTAEAAVEFVHLLAEYEGNGYNVYARAPQSSIKTVMHQHTHLIKPTGKSRSFLFYLRKPYLRLYR